MKNLKSKTLSYLKNNNYITPNTFQVNAATEIEERLINNQKYRIFKSSKLNKKWIYIHGSVGVGKSVLLCAINKVFPNSELIHFSDLIFKLQSQNKSSSHHVDILKKKKLLLIDEFFINNLTIYILFKNFCEYFENLKVTIILSGNHKLSKIYYDPVNPRLCKEINDKLKSFFSIIQVKSKVDYRERYKINKEFFLIGQRKNNSQIKIIKNLSSTSKSSEQIFRRKGNNFKLDKIYGNLIDLRFEDFFSKNFVFQDYEIIAKNIRIFVIRDIVKMNENSKNLISRFISFIDVLYENKNILSISTNVELIELYSGKTNANEFKRTISRLQEMGSNDYINKYLLK